MREIYYTIMQQLFYFLTWKLPKTIPVNGIKGKLWKWASRTEFKYHYKLYCMGRYTR